MDEAGPSKSWDRSTSSSVRIQFPAEDGGPARSSAVENARFASIGLGPPPILRRPAAEQSATIHDRRRRVRSVDAAAIFSEPTQSARAAEGSSANARRRTLTQAHQGAASKAASGVRSEGASSDLGTLSDEYALGQSDPGILEDVQRALKLKARREARLRALQANVSRNEVPSKSDRTTISSVSAGSSISPIEVSFPTSTPPTSHVPGLSNESDIDFSPSVGVTHLHPVPTSSNDGATLDWSRAGPPGYKPEHRRWTLSLSKGKAKERTPSLGKGVVEKQDFLYTQKLKRIREKARPNTIRKAAITSEQLQRRYNILYASLTSKAGPLNLAKVVGWYSSQEPIVRSTLDQAEPLTWLKHLLDKRGERASSRLPWHVTALIVEEYLKSQTHPDDIMSIGTSVTGSPVVDISQSSRDAKNMPSLTVHEQNFKRDEEQDEVNEELDRQEYERKAQMVEDAMAQNNRIRHLLQRVATGVKDYEYIRSHLSRLSDTEYGSLPQELVDAFSHDPAAVTGSTRRSKGWRAVEDVHNRLQRQNDILRSFIIQEKQDNKRSQTKSIFEDPISGLVDVLEKLEGHRQAIERKAGDVARMLTKVKPIHVQVKREYNQTLAHTSAVYDELSLIVRLEESYKDNYQQLWEFGMDALTFLLDTVTPFWRNYGKVIGEDVQDFLIIPWYRNEFTGEAKRYPIKRLPRRSFRHWLGLLLFSLSTLTITILQIRAAVYVSSLYRLPGINHTGLWWMVLPIYWTGFLIQWIAVLIECAIVGAQVAVVMWWVGWALNVFN
ncbi:hypothetical protein GLOTRDRAFT_67962 [Gloeophyllum trabeum ATCC 11539]|uniref:Uncharacterized protein n=1 Tax=Gloeophyllum trabeum (strain ATCC 11539 / FP-39264 / Madison 617) TaxID=670483 RepID=S7QKQ9_GLOTA|nr:uncharacterized protein GLOTRDRAFT_67962 [Gloeophyllum trabeum ATCC 11539]EPQ60381.1 hypothetical protein GLOTRDRAFT_67962 [Gloeophyllum trabeum ATCC 11539]